VFQNPFLIFVEFGSDICVNYKYASEDFKKKEGFVSPLV